MTGKLASHEIERVVPTRQGRLGGVACEVCESLLAGLHRATGNGDHRVSVADARIAFVRVPLN